MKNFTTLWLAITLALSSYQETNTGIHEIDIHYKFYQICGPLVYLEQIIQYKYTLQKSTDAPEIIKQFCYEKLRSQGIEIDQLQVKVVATEYLAAFGKNCIILGPFVAYELKKALENPTDTKSIDTLKVYSILLDHEISHLKNNDGPTKRWLVYTSASLISLGFISYITNNSCLSYLFQANTDNGYEKKISNTTATRFLMDISAQLFALFLYSRYTQFQEKRADAYAISLSKNPDNLRSTADFLERSEDNLISLLSNAKFNASKPFISSVMIALRKIFLTLYQIQKTDEDFHSWVKKQSLTPSIIRMFFDKEHPSGYSRAESMRTTANALES